MAPPGRVLVVGDVIADLIVIPDSEMRRGSDTVARILERPGGSAANQAVWLAAYGVPVTFVARVGAGDRDGLLTHFADLGVEAMLAGDNEAATGRIVTLVDPGGERSFFTDRGANALLDAGDLDPTLLDGKAWLHVSAYALLEPGPRAAVTALIVAARTRGIGTSLDCGSSGFLADLGPKLFLDTVAGADLVFANRDEAELLTGSDDVETQLRRLGERFACAVVKRGADGASAVATGGPMLHVAAEKVSAIDSTGAGDAFAAGFLSVHLGGGRLNDALRVGVAAGTEAVQMIGGQPGAGRG